MPQGVHARGERVIGRITGVGVKGYREAHIVLEQERGQRQRAHRLARIERRVKPDDLDIFGIERLANAGGLGQPMEYRVGTVHLERAEHDDLAAHAPEIERAVRIEPVPNGEGGDLPGLVRGVQEDAFHRGSFERTRT